MPVNGHNISQNLNDSSSEIYSFLPFDRLPLNAHLRPEGTGRSKADKNRNSVEVGFRVFCDFNRTRTS